MLFDATSAPDSAGGLDPNGAEDRRYIRHISVQGNYLRLAVRPAFGGRLAVLLDVSAGGMGFLLDVPLQVGDVLALDLKGSDPSGASVRLARVRYCRPHPAPADAPWLPRPSLWVRLATWLASQPAAPPGDAWLVGCAFNRPLEEAELGQLLTWLQNQLRSKS